MAYAQASARSSGRAAENRAGPAGETSKGASAEGDEGFDIEKAVASRDRAPYSARMSMESEIDGEVSSRSKGVVNFDRHDTGDMTVAVRNDGSGLTKFRQRVLPEGTYTRQLEDDGTWARWYRSRQSDPSGTSLTSILDAFTSHLLSLGPKARKGMVADASGARRYQLRATLSMTELRKIDPGTYERVKAKKGRVTTFETSYDTLQGKAHTTMRFSGFAEPVKLRKPDTD